MQRLPRATRPDIGGLYLTKVPLDDGSTVIADDDYLRESIIEPSAKVVRLSSDHAQLPRATFRGADHVAGGVHQVAGRGGGPSGVRATPATQPVNGQGPQFLPTSRPPGNAGYPSRSQ